MKSSSHSAHTLLFKILGASTILLGFASVAHATPHALPFSYPYATLPKGGLEFELYTDLVPVRIARELPSGSVEGVYSLRSVLQTEFEYGITDRLEFSAYTVFSQQAEPAPTLRFEGVKQRLRYRLGEEDDLPVNLGFYLEFAEFHQEFELEEKVILTRRIGPLNIISNLWFEQEYYFQNDELKYMYNPTLGASYELSPTITVGLEGWMRGRFNQRKTPIDPAMPLATDPQSARVYLGPTLLLQGGPHFFAIGAYTRVDHLSHNLEVNDPYGRLWFRTTLGVEL